MRLALSLEPIATDGVIVRTSGQGPMGPSAQATTQHIEAAGCLSTPSAGLPCVTPTWGGEHSTWHLEA